MNLFIILQELKSKSEKIAELQQKMVFISDQLQSYKKNTQKLINLNIEFDISLKNKHQEHSSVKLGYSKFIRTIGFTFLYLVIMSISIANF